VNLRLTLIGMFSITLVGCGMSSPSPIPTSPSPQPPVQPQSQRNPRDSTATILLVNIVPGEVGDYDCDFGCPSSIAVPRDSDGGYTLKASTEYSLVPTIGVDPPGCAASYQISFSWNPQPVQDDLCPHGDSYIEMTWWIYFVTPQASNLGALTSGQQILVLVRTNSGTSTVRIPIRFVQ